MLCPMQTPAPAPVTAEAAPAVIPYPNHPNPLQNQRTSNWMWFSLAIGFLLLLWLSFIAIRANPLYSDANLNGISKYKFIEGCREAIQEEVGKIAAQQPGLSVRLNARSLVDGVSSGYQSGAAPGVAPTTTPGWTLVTPVEVRRAGMPAQNIVLGCHYSKGGKIELIR